MSLSMPPPHTSGRRSRKLLLVAAVVGLGICFLVFRTNRTTVLENPRKVRVEATVVAPYDGTVGEVFAQPGKGDLPAGAPLFAYDVAAMREELGAVEAHADSLARSLPPAARILAGTPGAVSAAMQERNLAAAQNRETTTRLNLEAVSERLAQASVQVERLRAGLSRGEGTKTETTQALARRDEARAQLQGAEKAFEQASLERHKQEDLLRTLLDMERSLALEDTPLYRRFAAYKAAVGTAANLRFALEHAQVTLERGGIVSGIDIKPGDPITAGRVVARVSSPVVPAQVAAYGSFSPDSLRTGAEARVRLVRPDTGEEREAAATVSAVSPEGQGSVVVVTLSGEPGVSEAVFLTPESDLRVTIDR
jgi:multidrug resistance efflux pump